VAYTAAMFSVLTIGASMGLNIFSKAYIDTREYPGTDSLPPGPTGYRSEIYSTAIDCIPNVMFYLNTFLADGFLLYRCYVIYSMNYWSIALPSLMYLASLAMSVVLICYQTSKSKVLAWSTLATRFEVAYLSTSLSLNVLLTLMIATRLILHRRNIQNAIGPTTDGGLYNTVVTILVESCVIYAVDSLLLIGTFGAQSPVQDIFAPSFGNIQVIGSFLIILRVANRTALTSDTVATGNIGSIRFKSHGVSTGGNGTFPDANPMSSSMESDEETSSKAEAEARDGDMIEEVALS